MEPISRGLKLVSRASTVYKPTVRVNVLADNSDNHILECAPAARADGIVTGDRHCSSSPVFYDCFPAS
jgi:predicted nucleic acid-binding protein